MRSRPEEMKADVSVGLFEKNLKARIDLIEKRKEALRSLTNDLLGMSEKNPELLSEEQKTRLTHSLRYIDDLPLNLQKHFQEKLEADVISDGYPDAWSLETKRIEAIKRCHLSLDTVDKQFSRIIMGHRKITGLASKPAGLDEEKSVEPLVRPEVFSEKLDAIEDCLVLLEPRVEHADGHIQDIVKAIEDADKNGMTGIEAESVSAPVRKIASQVTVQQADLYADAVLAFIEGDQDAASGYIGQATAIARARREIKKNIHNALRWGNTEEFCKLLVSLLKPLDHVGHIFAGCERGGEPLRKLQSAATKITENRENVRYEYDTFSIDTITESYCELIIGQFKENIPTEEFKSERRDTVLSCLLKIQEDKPDYPGQKIEKFSDCLTSQDFDGLIGELDEHSAIGKREFHQFLHKILGAKGRISEWKSLAATCRILHQDFDEGAKSIDMLSEDYAFGHQAREELMAKVSISSSDEHSVADYLQASLHEIIFESHAVASGIAQASEGRDGVLLKHCSYDDFYLCLLAMAKQLHVYTKQLSSDKEVVEIKQMSILFLNLVRSISEDGQGNSLGQCVKQISYLLKLIEDACPNVMKSVFMSLTEDEKILQTCLKHINLLIEQNGGMKALLRDAKTADEAAAYQRELAKQQNDRMKKITKDLSGRQDAEEKAVDGAVKLTGSMSNTLEKLIHTEKAVSTILLGNDSKFETWKTLHDRIVLMHEHGKSMAKMHSKQKADGFIRFSDDLMKELRCYLRDAVGRNPDHQANSLNTFQQKMQKMLDDKAKTVAHDHRRIWYPLLAFIGNALVALTVVGAIGMYCTNWRLFKPKTTRVKMIEETTACLLSDKLSEEQPSSALNTRP